MKTEMEGSLHSSVNHENGDGSKSGCSTESEMEGMDHSIFLLLPCLLLSSLRHKLPSVKCERDSDDGSASGNGKMNRLRLCFRRWCESSFLKLLLVYFEVYFVPMR